MPFHECSAADFEQYYPISYESKATFDQITESEERGFYCVDWKKADVEIYETDTENRLDVSIMLLPCNILDTSGGITEDSIGESCVRDLDE